MITNCSNNYGPRQFPEKLAPTCVPGSTWKTTWMRCCVGGSGSNGTARERTNKEVVEVICSALDDLLPAGAPHSRLVTQVTDRPGYDRRYAIDPTRISSELGLFVAFSNSGAGNRVMVSP